jgi:hypothetical protein
MQITMPLMLWREAVGWAAAATVKTFAGNGTAQYGLHVLTVDHPPHYGDGWEMIHPDHDGVTLLAADRFRMCWSTVPLSDLVTATFDVVDPAGPVSLHLPGVLQAMRAWPKATDEYAYQVRLEVGSDAAALWLSRDGDEYARSIILLHTGEAPALTPAWFAKHVTPAKKPADVALNPTLLLPLVSAASKLWGSEALRIRGSETSALLSRKPVGDAPVFASGLQMGVQL